jgi:hypothetical protein
MISLIKKAQFTFTKKSSKMYIIFKLTMICLPAYSIYVQNSTTVFSKLNFEQQEFKFDDFVNNNEVN